MSGQFMESLQVELDLNSEPFAYCSADTLKVIDLRYFRDRVSYFDQSEAINHSFVDSDWSKY